MMDIGLGTVLIIGIIGFIALLGDWVDYYDDNE